ncbi:MAG: GNAT family N-acetyltransferase [Prolixibacteraceae bacterium]|nr:GNAT family N-acetyltransferase [Prolixibacteraceae bacterium]MBN2775614.1 GNAT family N-acetyltransferase [Prolixibacteraceae bacterium]
MEYLRIDDNLQLERVKLSFSPIIFDAIDKNREFLRKWLPFVDQTRKPSDTEAFLKSILETPVADRDEVYSIWYKGEFTGLIAYKDTDRLNCKTELGYWITEKMQGKGIVTKSAAKLVDFAFRNLNMNRIQIRVAVGNKKSAAVAKRLNFTFEGIERDGEKHLSKFLDLEVYSFLKKEWIENLRKI